MRANTEPSFWPEGRYHSLRVAIISVSSSSQTWLTFTIKMKFKRLTSNSTKSVKKCDHSRMSSDQNNWNISAVFKKDFNMRKIWLRLAKTIFEFREWNYVGCLSKVAPGQKVRAVCTFELEIRIHYLVIDQHINYLLSVFSALKENWYVFYMLYYSDKLYIEYRIQTKSLLLNCSHREQGVRGYFSYTPRKIGQKTPHFLRMAIFLHNLR